MKTGLISLGSRGEISRLILNGSLQKMEIDFEYDKLVNTVLFETIEEYETRKETNGLLIDAAHVEGLINRNEVGDYKQLLHYLKQNLERVHRGHEFIWIVLDTSQSREKALYYFVLAALKNFSPNIKTGVISEFAAPSEGISRVRNSVDWFSEYFTKLEAISPMIPWNRGADGSASSVLQLIRALDFLLNKIEAEIKLKEIIRDIFNTVGIWSIAEMIDSKWKDTNGNTGDLSEELEKLVPLTREYQFDVIRDLYRFKTPSWQVGWSISEEIPTKQFELQDVLY